MRPPPPTCACACAPCPVVKEGWKLAWQIMVRELAPQDRSGSYVRQSYAFSTSPADIKVGGDQRSNEGHQGG